MATAKKKRGAPASASKRERLSKKPPKAVRRAINSAVSRAKKEMAVAHVQAELVPPSLPIIGRPPFPYTDALDEQLFCMISAGMSMDKISKIEGMPGVTTMLCWIADKTHRFSSTYVRAKEIMVPLLEERAQAAATEALKGEIRIERSGLDRFGQPVDSEEVRIIDNVERSKLILTAYQWTLSHLLPKKHGRNAQPGAPGVNPQLQALFDNINSGPVKGGAK